MGEKPSTTMPDAFYHPIDTHRFLSTTATAGPWSERTQHGGPPSALVGAALEAFQPRPGLRIARMTIELPRPVPVAELTVQIRMVHSGRRTELLEGTLHSEGQQVLLARAWRVACSPVDTPVLRPEVAPPSLPGTQPPPGMTGAHHGGYLSAIEWRFPDGGDFDSRGAGTVWARQRIPLLPGVADSPLTRALVLADSNWAVAFELDHHRQLVINTDVSLMLHRDPVGEWLCIRSATVASPAGSALATGSLDDCDGDCGRILQTLLVSDR
jgi:hypothetical protein